MPIWSLTKERVDKLLKQIGDKELEIDSLIKLSKEHLWNMDLDEFIKEWRFQLENETKRQKKAASQGRRVSSKLKTQVKPLGRKRKHDDSSNSDFSSKKTKKPSVVRSTKTAAVVSTTAAKSAHDTLTSVTNLLEHNSASNTKTDADKDPGLSLGGTDGLSPDVSIAPISTETKIRATTKRSAPSKVVTTVSAQSDGEVDDEKPKTRPSAIVGLRAPRGAARKTIKYTTLSGSESEEEDMLFDVGKMVRGINSSAVDVSVETRPIRSTTTQSRPRGSVVSRARKMPAQPHVHLDDSDDETDYARLARPWMVTQEPRRDRRSCPTTARKMVAQSSPPL